MFMYTLDHVQAEPESEVQEEQVLEAFEGPKRQVVWILTLILNKASPSVSHHIHWLLFVSNHYSYVILDCALSL
jgi:hypothetical protein